MAGDPDFFPVRWRPGHRESRGPHLSFCRNCRLASLVSGLVASLFTGIFLGLSAGTCSAGLTASEVVVVVNGNSTNSRTLANHYVKMRGIPSINVIVLDSVPNTEVATVEVFRERILRPLFEQIAGRGLSNHVQCIAYSADFPTAINLRKDLASLTDLPKIFTPVGSINGMTFLYELTIAENPGYLGPEINYYARRPMDSYFSNPAGAATAERWDSINSLIGEGKHDEAATQLQELVRQLPHQFPLTYMAAANAALADQPDRAIQLLEEAINQGWNSGGYLANDSRFDALRDRDDFQLLEILLDQDIGKWQATVGFNHRTHWSPNGVRFLAPADAPAPGMRYFLSIVLGVTRGGGTTLQEAIEALQRSSQADSTHPEGTFFFTSTSDVRTQTREPLFADAIAELERLGFRGTVLNSRLPSGMPSVLGAQIGTPNFNWPLTRSTLVPGSIADNLTSLGGVMTSTGGQTKLTELIKAGAAGSSGTVTEPYAVPFKFPSPFLYAHYAQGASLAEAFYQSVTGPYQLLIVGDPLCQPFSIAPRPISAGSDAESDSGADSAIRTMQPNQKMNLELDLSGLSYSDWLTLPADSSKRKEALAPSRIAVQIDGLSPRGGAVQQTVTLDLEGISPGYHEIRVLLIADDPINQRSTQTMPVWIGPEDAIRLSLASGDPEGNGSEANQFSFQGENLVATVEAPSDCKEVSIWHHSELLAAQASPESASTELPIAIEQLGMGPIRLQARAELQDGSMIASRPVWCEVVP
jgi:hypothetical protein